MLIPGMNNRVQCAPSDRLRLTSACRRRPPQGSTTRRLYSFFKNDRIARRLSDSVSREIPFNCFQELCEIANMLIDVERPGRPQRFAAHSFRECTRHPYPDGRTSRRAQSRPRELIRSASDSQGIGHNLHARQTVRNIKAFLPRRRPTRPSRGCQRQRSPPFPPVAAPLGGQNFSLRL